jgi:hypothetical protein
MMRKAKSAQSGFSTPFIMVLAVLVVVGIGTVGAMVYHSHKSNPVVSTTVSSSTQPTKKSTTSTSTQTQKSATTTTAYLDITQWGVRMTLNSTTSSMDYYINPQQPDVAFLSLAAVSNVAPLCAANANSLGAISRFTDSQQQTATSKGLQPGTIQIGDYWYGFAKPNAGCTNDSATTQAAIDAAVPNLTSNTIQDTFNTLSADPSN